jgi:hypothetical protein
MATVLRELIPHLAALFLGGLVSSFGLTSLARRPAGRTFLGRVKVWGIAAFAVVTVGGLLGGFYWLISGIRAGLDADATMGSPLSYLLLGLVTGLPLSLPGVITVWSDARPEKAEARARKAKAATKHDRLEFVQNLVRQIEEYADTPREVSASLTGDDGTVLLFKGDLERHEGDKLVAALRSELLEHGFTRVEGEGPKGKWWSRV